MVIRSRTERQLKDPRVVEAVFGDTRMAMVWLVVRLWLGGTWLEDGRQKLADPAWMHGGEALRRSWELLIGTPGGGTPIAGGWYAGVLKFLLDHRWYAWMGKAIAVSEVLIGLALLLGLLTGVAALLGVVLSTNFLLVGASALNPVALLVSLGMVSAWKVAGYIGLDAYVLPKLGAPWGAGLFWTHVLPGEWSRRSVARRRTPSPAGGAAESE